MAGKIILRIGIVHYSLRLTTYGAFFPDITRCLRRGWLWFSYLPNLHVLSRFH